MIKKSLIALGVVFLTAGLLAMSVAAYGAEPAKFRFGTASFPGLPTHAATIKYAEMVKEKSAGRSSSNRSRRGNWEVTRTPSNWSGPGPWTWLIAPRPCSTIFCPT